MEVSDTLAFTQQFIPGHSAHTIQFTLIILGVLIGPMCAHIGGTHECGEVQSHARVVSIADGDTTTLVDCGFATEYCFALHACKISWAVALLTGPVETGLQFQGSSAGILQAMQSFRPYALRCLGGGLVQAQDISNLALVQLHHLRQRA